jgi:hypothetical protein
VHTRDSACVHIRHLLCAHKVSLVWTRDPLCANKSTFVCTQEISCVHTKEIPQNDTRYVSHRRWTLWWAMSFRTHIYVYVLVLNTAHMSWLSTCLASHHKDSRVRPSTAPHVQALITACTCLDSQQSTYVLALNKAHVLRLNTACS